MLKAGDKHGMLTALQSVGSPRNRWMWRCDCGAVVTKEAAKVMRLQTRSCGCLRREMAKLHIAQHRGPGNNLPRHQNVVRRAGTGGIREIVTYCQERSEHRARYISYKFGRPDLFAFQWPQGVEA